MSTPQTYPTKPRTRLEPRGTIVLFVFINRVPVSLWSSEKRTEREKKKGKTPFSSLSCQLTDLSVIRDYNENYFDLPETQKKGKKIR